MSVLAPPPAPPVITEGDDDRMRRFRRRMTQVSATTLTVLATGWLCTLGPIPGIVGCMVAKHILVAVLLMDSGIHQELR
jgi:hypothetical protein